MTMTDPVTTGNDTEAAIALFVQRYRDYPSNHIYSDDPRALTNAFIALPEATKEAWRSFYEFGVRNSRFDNMGVSDFDRAKGFEFYQSTENFFRWVRSEGTTITDAGVPIAERVTETIDEPVVTVASATIEEIDRCGRDLTVASFAPWVPTFIRWVETVGYRDAYMDSNWRTDSHNLSTLATVEGRNPNYADGPRHLAATMPAFAAWLREHDQNLPDPVTTGNAVTEEQLEREYTIQGDTATAPAEPAVLPIDHNHPGWFAFDKQMAEIAESRGMCGQYEVVGRQMGLSPRRHNHEVTVTLTLNVVTERGHRPTRSDIAAAITAYVEGRGLLNATTVSTAITVEPTTTN